MQLALAGLLILWDVEDKQLWDEPASSNVELAAQFGWGGN
jgi:hypothetical protein